MITKTWPGGPKDDLETDICVIGAGPAGISFARALIGSIFSICVLESGSFEPDIRAQMLGRGKVDSIHYSANALSVGRERQFGGTSNQWLFRTQPGNGRKYAKSVPPQGVDFEAAACRNGFHWPFSFESLRPYYQRGQMVWNGGPFDYGIEKWADPSAAPLVFPNGKLTTEMCQHGPADVFIKRYRDELIASENVTLHVGCTALELETNGTSASIKSVRVARADGSTFSVRAKKFVLAGGGIENAQLLLLSEVARPGGLANKHDNVGRYVTDHPEFRMGTITPASRDVFEKLGLYDIRWVGQLMISSMLSINEETKRSMGLLNVGVALVPRPAGFGTAAHRALNSLLAVGRGELTSAALADLASVFQSPGDALATWKNRGGDYEEFSGGWSRPEVDRQQFRSLELWSAAEQTPDRENRITLADERDWLGRQQPKLQWRWSRDDQDNINRSIAIFASELEGSGLGRFTRWVEFEGTGRPRYGGIHHPMGSTRMDPDPKFGVVDADCRVHGTDNLYVAGSSVFPTGNGYANPTLTILALALRLADHIKATSGTAV